MFSSDDEGPSSRTRRRFKVTRARSSAVNNARTSSKSPMPDGVGAAEGIFDPPEHISPVPAYFADPPSLSLVSSPTSPRSYDSDASDLSENDEERSYRGAKHTVIVRTKTINIKPHTKGEVGKPTW